MSILEVKNLSHGFGDRAIFENVSFRLLKTWELTRLRFHLFSIIQIQHIQKREK